MCSGKPQLEQLESLKGTSVTAKELFESSSRLTGLSASNAEMHFFELRGSRSDLFQRSITGLLLGDSGFLINAERLQPSYTPV